MSTFETLFEDNHTFIFQYLIALTRDPSLAEELTSETFFRAYINIAGLRQQASARAWLCRIAKNVFLSWCRAQKRFVPLDDAVSVGTTASAEDTVIQREQYQQAMAEIAALEEPYKEVFLLSVYGGCSSKDISAMFGKSESWARHVLPRQTKSIGKVGIIMECAVIRDLLPLYIDDCCSPQTAAIVTEHLASCKACAAAHRNMTSQTAAPVPAPKVLRRVCEWKASVIQTVVLLLSFAALTAGVANEAATPEGAANGLWTVWLIIPATGFLLSAVNWYFVRLYKSKTAFALASAAVMLGIMLAAYGWAAWHYDISLPLTFGRGIAMTAACCVISRLLSGMYAALLGKE